MSVCIPLRATVDVLKERKQFVFSLMIFYKPPYLKYKNEFANVSVRVCCCVFLEQDTEPPVALGASLQPTAP